MKDAATDGSGNLYFWLPEGSSTSIAVSDGTTLYEYSAVVVANTNSCTGTLAAGSGDATLHTVTYDGNSPGGGSVPLDNAPYLASAQVRVSGNTGGLTKTGYAFSGWGIAGTGLSVQPGGTFTMPASAVTLTAVWKSTDATITGYDLGGVTTGTLGTPDAAPALVTTAGAVALTSTQATNAAFSATPANAKATVQYATGTTPTFGAWTPATIASGDNVWIEVTAEDGVTVLVYKIVVTVTPPPTYSITVGSFTVGSVSANKASAAAGEIVTLTVYPAGGYELGDIRVHKTGEVSVSVGLNGFNGFNGLNFTMPDFDVTVLASFSEIPPPEPDPDAVALDGFIYTIRNLHVIVPQEEANTESEVAYWLRDSLARLFEDKGWDITVQTLTVVNFFPATAGTRDVPGTNGSFSFFAMLRKGYVTDRTYNMDGTVTATPYAIPTGNESAETGTSVYFRKHTLYICSPVAETVEVYSFSGAKLLSAKKEAGEAGFTVPAGEKAVIVRGSSGWTRKAIDN
ncbi:hypothetical protein FACS1894181_03190 [Bacteroidia bacterium]|nr:hypothetical protein FACS1894181_03190 [Bacteroidia bacterium]